MASGNHKKALIVANTAWNIHNFRQNIIKALLREGFDVVVASPTDEFMGFLAEFPAIRHIPLRHLARKGLNPFTDLWLIRELTRIYRKESPSIIIHYTIKPNIYGSIAARLTGHVCLSVITGLGYTFIHNGLIGGVSKFLYKKALRWNAKVIFENQDDRLLFEREGIIPASLAVSVKGCGINTEHFSPRPAGVSLSGKTTFLFVGRLLYDKGIREFVEAARKTQEQAPDTRFVVVGDMDGDNPATVTRRDLDAWVAAGGIEYKGFLHDVRDEIAAADCVVLPSYREAIARSLQEGMAMGKPVISTDVPGCREAVDDGDNGFLVPVRDAAALAEAMLRFVRLPERERARMGERGRHKVEQQFDEGTIAAEYMRIIGEVFA